MYPQQLRRLTWATSFSNVSTFFPRNKHGMVMGFLTKWCHWFAVDMFFTRYIQGAVKCQLIELGGKLRLMQRCQFSSGRLNVCCAVFFYKLDTVTWVKVTENKCRNRGMLEVFGIIWPHLWHDVWWGSSPIGNLRGNFNLFYSMCLLEGKALTFPSLCTYSFCLNHRNASTFAGCSPFQTAVSWLIHGVY